MTKKRIFVACSDARLKIALLLLLDHEPGMAVMGMTDRLTGLLIQLEATQPDILLLEWELPIKEIEELLSDIHNLPHRPMITVLSNKPEEKGRIIAAGADHFIPKDAPPDDLLPILHDSLITT
jgi:DNA-binding NarL/FixJ family response regulator